MENTILYLKLKLRIKMNALQEKFLIIIKGGLATVPEPDEGYISLKSKMLCYKKFI